MLSETKAPKVSLKIILIFKKKKSCKLILCSTIRNNGVLLAETIENTKWSCGGSFNIHSSKLLQLNYTLKKKIFFGFWYINTRCLLRFSRKMRCVCALTSHQMNFIIFFSRLNPSERVILCRWQTDAQTTGCLPESIPVALSHCCLWRYSFVTVK